MSDLLAVNSAGSCSSGMFDAFTVLGLENPSAMRANNNFSERAAEETANLCKSIIIILRSMKFKTWQRCNSRDPLGQ